MLKSQKGNRTLLVRIRCPRRGIVTDRETTNNAWHIRGVKGDTLTFNGRILFLFFLSHLSLSVSIMILGLFLCASFPVLYTFF